MSVKYSIYHSTVISSAEQVFFKHFFFQLKTEPQSISTHFNLQFLLTGKEIDIQINYVTVTRS